MNRDEKNSKTREKIIHSALEEFSEKSYGEASLNTVCAEGNISKGIIYHYFKDKDELYLVCVKECFDALLSQLQKAFSSEGEPMEKALENYFSARIEFFDKNPTYLKLFCNVMINPPIHLALDIAEIKAELDDFNVRVLAKLLKNEKLRSDVSLNEIISVFFEYQDFVNARFQMQAFGKSTLRQHEERCARSLKILLYGVIEREA
ncbi:MAG: TetR/AcrR family transcriptional regulator [Oscillospiraceae bacterium]